MAAPTLEGTTDVDLGASKVKMIVERNLFRSRVPFTGTNQAIVDSVTGALRTIQVTGIIKGNSTVLNGWEDDADYNWASTSLPEVKKFTTQSGNAISVLPDRVEYDRFYNRIVYRLSLIQTIKSAVV